MNDEELEILLQVKASLEQILDDEGNLDVPIQHLRNEAEAGSEYHQMILEAREALSAHDNYVKNEL